MIARVCLAFWANTDSSLSCAFADLAVRGPSASVPAAARKMGEILQELPEDRERILHIRNVLVEVVELFVMKGLPQLACLFRDPDPLRAQATIQATVCYERMRGMSWHADRLAWAG